MDLVARALVKKTLKESAVKKFNSQNPYEDEVEVLDKRGQPTGKFKKHKRGVPVGLSANDSAVLKKVRRRAYRLDMSLFNCCGIRFGWSSIIGIIPFIGDAIDALMALMVVNTCAGIDGGLPQTLRTRMMFNVALDFGLGLIPILGDVADAVFRANTRNAWLLEVYLRKRLEAQSKGHVSDPELGNPKLPTRPAAARTNPEPAVPDRPVSQGIVGQPNEPIPMSSLNKGGRVATAPGSAPPKNSMGR